MGEATGDAVRWVALFLAVALADHGTPGGRFGTAKTGARSMGRGGAVLDRKRSRRSAA
jgi:hypothetical protein